MTSQELMMSNEVEEYSDELRRELDDEVRISSTNITFQDFENMEVTNKAVVIFVVLCALLVIIKFFLCDVWQKESEYKKGQ